MLATAAGTSKLMDGSPRFFRCCAPPRLCSGGGPPRQTVRISVWKALAAPTRNVIANKSIVPPSNRLRSASELGGSRSVVPLIKPIAVSRSTVTGAENPSCPKDHRKISSFTALLPAGAGGSGGPGSAPSAAPILQSSRKLPLWGCLCRIQAGHEPMGLVGSRSGHGRSEVPAGLKLSGRYVC
jgi:hypothetical protein